ncbi:MAG: MarR family winged helix-turn-helix transcriptional regulator [Candidatus Peribacteraceae bacterium]|nr:MarR family winged helix-turn-helix transcriptional regulator [Candidatus Peribacteraceae bacterium]
MECLGIGGTKKCVVRRIEITIGISLINTLLIKYHTLMLAITSSLKLFLNLATVQAVMSRRFDGRLGSLGLTEFLILFHLAHAQEEKMRRIDLAESIGLTASGVTRLLAPMEKIGLVKREANAADARVSFVALTTGGKDALENALENAEYLAKETLFSATKEEIAQTSALLQKLGGTVR